MGHDAPVPLHIVGLGHSSPQIVFNRVTLSLEKYL